MMKQGGQEGRSCLGLRVSGRMVRVPGLLPVRRYEDRWKAAREIHTLSLELIQRHLRKTQLGGG